MALRVRHSQMTVLHELQNGLRPNWSRLFPAQGHGTVIFNLTRCTPFSIVIRVARPEQDKWIALEIFSNMARFLIFDGTKLSTVCRAVGDNVGFEPKEEISYWFSYDRDNLVIQYGKGYRMEETTIMKHDFLCELSKDEQKQKRIDLYDYFNPVTAKYIEEYDLNTKTVREMVIGNQMSLPKPKTDSMGHVDFDFHPFITNLPPVLLPSSRATLLDIDSGDKMLSGSLPKACQELYQNISNVDLDWLEEREGCKLSDAIRYSINTEGCVLYNKLLEKAGTFGSSNSSQTYLRVTLGPCRGDSPGVPYVLEIWPSSHHSPIHGHGNAYAIIKVVHGSINVRIYNKHALSLVSNDVSKHELMMFIAETNDVTWMSPHWYQTHQLWNESDDFCATIQAYKYSDEDRVHWPYFNYVREITGIGEFLPSSDFTFKEMHDLVIQEYKSRTTET